MFVHGEITVPEVFGWRRHDGFVFIYMSLIRGRNLREAWPSLTERDKDGSPGSHKIVAVLDWEQAGWYPESWEDSKMHLGAAGDKE
jgi:hypothetical protein